MKDIKINKATTTLVDQIEDRLLSYFKEQNYKVGDVIPNELELAAALGVARNVLREALSRLKMVGLVESRTRRGMILTEPSLFSSLARIVDPRILSDDTLYGIIGFRVAMEIGLCNEIVRNVTDKDITDLEGLFDNIILPDDNIYLPMQETIFHFKLYQISRNSVITDFQKMLYPIMNYINEHFCGTIQSINKTLKEKGMLVGHKDIISALKTRDADVFRKALENHFVVYTRLIEMYNASKSAEA